MSLAKGLYVIESRLTGGTVGRNIREDRSFRPKPIVVHPTSGGLLYQATVCPLTIYILFLSYSVVCGPTLMMDVFILVVNRAQGRRHRVWNVSAPEPRWARGREGQGSVRRHRRPVG